MAPPTTRPTTKAQTSLDHLSDFFGERLEGFLVEPLPVVERRLEKTHDVAVKSQMRHDLIPTEHAKLRQAMM